MKKEEIQGLKAKSASSFNWRKLQKYLNPQAVKDFDKLLDNLPLTVGYNAIIAAALMWLLAGGAFFFASSETKKATELRAELLAVEALKPPVPEVVYTPVSKAALEEMAKRINELGYPELTLRAESDGSMKITGPTSALGAFRNAIGQVAFGDKGWRVELQSLCAGRECEGSGLSADLKISAARIVSSDELQPAKETPDKKAGG